MPKQAEEENIEEFDSGIGPILEEPEKIEGEGEVDEENQEPEDENADRNGQQSEENDRHSEPEGKDTDSDDDVQAKIDRALSSRLNEVKIRHKAELRREKDLREQQDAEIAQLRKQLEEAAGQHNQLVDAVSKDEFSDIPPEMRQRINVPDQQAANHNYVPKVLTARPLDQYTSSDMQNYVENGRTLMVEAVDILPADELQRIHSKFTFLEQSGKIPSDSLIHIGNFDNKLEIVKELVDNPEIRQRLELAAHKSRNSGNPGHFVEEMQKISGEIGQTGTSGNGMTKNNQKKGKPKTENTPGRRQGTHKNSGEIEVPIIDL